MADEIRVFVGSAANNEDLESQAVLEHTIRKHASRPVSITWMQHNNNQASPWGCWESSRWCTPFSGFRWAIPEVCGFQGKAIYMDSDMIVNADLAELIDQPHPPGKALLARGGGQWRICVSVWDCEAAQKLLPPLEKMKKDPLSHRNINRNMIRHIAPFSGRWNYLDKELGPDRDPRDPKIKILHYTDMRSQPQIRHASKRLAKSGQLHWYDGKTTPERFPNINAYFDELLTEATAKGYTPDRYIREPFGPYKKKSYRGRK